MDKRADLAMALAMMLFGIWFFWAASQIPHSTRLGEPIGPGGIPMGMGLVVAIGGAAAAVKRLLKWRREPNIVAAEGEEDEPGHKVSHLRVALVALLYLLVAVSFERVGFLISTPIFIALTLAVLGVRNWRTYVGLSLGVTLVLFLGFSMLFHVRFPEGPLDRFFLR